MNYRIEILKTKMRLLFSSAVLFSVVKAYNHVYTSQWGECETQKEFDKKTLNHTIDFMKRYCEKNHYEYLGLICRYDRQLYTSGLGYVRNYYHLYTRKVKK